MKVIFLKSLLLSGLITCFDIYSDENINLLFNGNIKATPCQIEQTNYIIDLKTVNIANIRNNQKAPWVNFSINLKNCPLNTRESVMTLTGVPEPTNSDYFRNSGSATNVTLDLASGSSQIRVKNGSQITTPINQQTHRAEIPFSARVTSLNTAMTAGSFRSHVEFILTYN